MADTTTFSVKTKRGERKEGLKGLSFNTNKLREKENPGYKAKRRQKWEANKNAKAAANRDRHK